MHPLITILVVTGAVILFFALLVLVTVVIPEKFREKEGKRERVDIVGADPSSISGEVTSLILTADDKAVLSPIPKRCKVFAWTEDGETCHVLTTKGEMLHLPFDRIEKIIPTGIDGVPILERIEDVLKFSLLARDDLYIGQKYILYTPNIATAPGHEWRAFFHMEYDERSAKLHSARKAKQETLCFRVDCFDEQCKYGVFLVSYDQETGRDIPGEEVHVESSRIFTTCRVGDLIKLDDNYIFHC